MENTIYWPRLNQHLWPCPSVQSTVFNSTLPHGRQYSRAVFGRTGPVQLRNGLRLNLELAPRCEGWRDRVEARWTLYSWVISRKWSRSSHVEFDHTSCLTYFRYRLSNKVIKPRIGYNVVLKIKKKINFAHENVLFFKLIKITKVNQWDIYNELVW